MIVVAGATGQLGSRVAHRLLAEGRSLRVLVRPGSDYASLEAGGAYPVIGDLKDPGSLDRAVAGADTIITTANSAQRGGDDNPRSVDLEGNAHLIEAAQRAGVRRFIFISALGATVDSPDPFIAAKAATEDRLRQSGLDFTILASTPFIDVWVGMVVLGPITDRREVVYAGDGRRRHSMIAMADVAAFMTAVVDHPAASRAYVPIGGPAPFSWRDAIAATETVLRRPATQRGVPPGERVPGLPDPVQGLVAFLGTVDLELDSREIASTFGVSLTTMDEWVRQVVGDPKLGDRRAEP